MLSFEFKMYLILLLGWLFVGSSIFLREQILEKRKITFDFSLIPILFYSIILFLTIFLLLFLDVFLFIPILNKPPETYVEPPIIGLSACQFAAFIIYLHLIKKVRFKPRNILLTAVFFILAALSMLIIIAPAMALFFNIIPYKIPAYSFAENCFIIGLKILSFALAIVIFELGSKIFAKIKNENIRFD